MMNIIVYFRNWLNERYYNNLRRAVILGILLLSIILPSIAPSRFLLAILVLILGFGAGLILIRHPNLGFVILIIASLIVPFSIGTGSESDIHAGFLVLILLIALWFLDLIVLKRHIQFLASRPFRPLLVFVIGLFISFGFGQLPWFYTQPAPIRAQIGEVMIFLLSVGAFFLVAHRVQVPKGLEWITYVFLGLGAYYILSRYVPFLGNLTSRLYPIGSTASIFWIWLMALSCSQAIFNNRLAMRWRFTLGLITLSTLYYAFMLNRAWTSGWLPGLVAVIVTLLVGAPRIIFPLSILFGGLAVLNLNFLSSIIWIGDNNTFTFSARQAAWDIVLQIAKVNPLFGVGPANYYWYSPLFHIFNYYVPINSHNNYVDLIAQTGIFGLICFLWFAWEIGRLGWRLRLTAPEGFLRAFVYGALGGLVGTLASGMLGDWFLPFVYNVGFIGFRSSVLAWIFLGALVAIEQSTARE